jgi:serine/threonine protein kinase
VPVEAGRPAPPNPEGESFTAPRPSVREKPSSGLEAPVSSASCLQNDEILAYRAGETSDEQRARIDEHLDECENCRALVHVLLQDDSPPSTAAPQLALTFARGDVLAKRYEIRRFLAHGGMGEVYEAFDTLGRKRVALKTVLCSSSDNPKAVQKLVEEVRNAQRVTHPNVCRINELHQHESSAPDALAQYFLTMEFVEGEKLGTRLRREALPLPAALNIARQLLEGLRAAHRQGVLHLDFKSDNVILRDTKGTLEAVIMDFGLSRALDTQSQMRTSERRQLAGTVYYMAPEQVQCSPDLGPAADVYAFGVVLFEMLTGEFPFDGDSPYAIMLQRLNKRPRSPSQFVSGLPSQLETFVLECLARDPRARWADAGEALAAFDRLNLLHQPPSPRRRKNSSIAAVLVLLAVVASFAYFRWVQREPAQTESALHPAMVHPAMRTTPVPPAAAPAAAEPQPAPPPAAPRSVDPAPADEPPAAAEPANTAQSASAPAPPKTLGAPRISAPRGTNAGKGSASLSKDDGAPSHPAATLAAEPARSVRADTPTEPPQPTQPRSAPTPAEPKRPEHRPPPALPGAPPGLL